MPSKDGDDDPSLGGDGHRVYEGGDLGRMGSDTGVAVASDTDDSCCEGGNVGVGGRGREDDSDMVSVYSEIGSGSKDDLLIGMVLKGGSGDGGKL